VDEAIAVTIKPELVDALLEYAGTPEALFGPGGLFQRLKGALMERMLEAEMSAHLAEESRRGGEKKPRNGRNGHTVKTVQTDSGPVEVRVPRDRTGTFSPTTLAKNQRRTGDFNSKVLALYAGGMSVRDIQQHLRDVDGTEVSPELISKVTDSALVEAKAWLCRPLGYLYPVVYLDALYVAIRDGATVSKKAVHVAMGIGLDGKREVLGLWFEQTEGARFWLGVLTELKNRGVGDIFFLCTDGLNGLPKAIEAAFPRAIVQTCIVHVIRAALRYVGSQDRQAVARAMRPIYSAENADTAAASLDAFAEQWGARYPQAIKTWRARWTDITPFLAFPSDVRTILYTTNAIESLNFQLRQALNPRGHFPHEDAALKVLHLALQRAHGRWKAPRQWSRALAHFAVLFEDRMPAS
jgi:putative transposase